MKLSVVINFQFEAIHNWPGCPFEDVDFLKSPHRHVFHVRAEKAVSHTDRDVEIIMFKREVEEFVKSQIPRDLNMGRVSCEDIAVSILKRFDCEFVEVLEDGENGAIARGK